MNIRIPSASAVALSVAFVLAGCCVQTAAPGGGQAERLEPVPETRTAAMSKLETLHAFSATPETLTFSVISTGCTRPEDFVVETRSVDGRCHVSILRIRPDRCRRAPYRVTLTRPWHPVSGCLDNLVLANPMASQSRQAPVDR